MAKSPGGEFGVHIVFDLSKHCGGRNTARGKKRGGVHPASLVSVAALSVLWVALAQGAEKFKCERLEWEPVQILSREDEGTAQQKPGFGIYFEFDEELGPVIVIDNIRARRLPWLVREFEIARECVLVLKAEKRADWNPDILHMRFKNPKRYKEATNQLIENMREVSEEPDRRNDCEALDRLRRNQIAGYEELRELVDFYASVEKRFGDLPRELTVYRAKNLLSCSRS